MMMLFMFIVWQEGGFEVAKGTRPILMRISEEEYIVIYKWAGFMGKIYNESGECVRGCEGETLVLPNVICRSYGDWGYGKGVIYLVMIDNKEVDDGRYELYIYAIDTLFNSLWGEEGIKLADDSLSPNDPRVSVGGDGVYVVWEEFSRDTYKIYTRLKKISRLLNTSPI